MTFLFVVFIIRFITKLRFPQSENGIRDFGWRGPLNYVSYFRDTTMPLLHFLLSMPNTEQTLCRMIGCLMHAVELIPCAYLQPVQRSLDSGNETMGTDAIHCETAHIGNHGTKQSGLMNVLVGIKETDQETLPPYMKHPPSPPVRLRSRYGN